MNKQVESKQGIEEMRYLFQVMVRQFGLLQNESSQCCGITTVQSQILYEIKNTHQLSLNELSERLGLDNSTTSRHVHGLVEKGHVQRQPHPHDRRFVTLDLTDQGTALEEEINDMMTAYIVGIFNQLPEGKMHSISTELKHLTQAMRKSGYCCTPPF